MFGDWFGREFDNCHLVRSARAEGEDLVVVFHEDEELWLARPVDWEFNEHVFRVQRAARVVWRWYSYGRPKVPENLFTIDHWVDDDGGLHTDSDVTWYHPTFSSSIDSPAAELL